MPLDWYLTNWQDNDVRFDVLPRFLKPVAGEKTFEVLDPIEDTKGNNGQPGRLIVTNLRIIWQSKKHPKINLSIGYNQMTNVSIKTVTSKLKGQTESLHILARTKVSRYEFIFTNLVVDNNRLFPVVIGVHRAYGQSRLYREIKMRSALIINNKKLQLLPEEQICEHVNGVWNLSSDQGNLGSFYVTNVRLVWYASSNELFNASIPFLHISEVKVRDSKFGKALVVETSNWTGNYVLGFRIDPKEKLTGVYKTLISIHETFLQNPVYGVEFNSETIELEREEEKRAKLNSAVEDNVQEIDEDPNLISDAFAAYFVEGYEPQRGEGEKEPQVVFCPELGLAIEKPKDGFTIQQLWEVIPS